MGSNLNLGLMIITSTVANYKTIFTWFRRIVLGHTCVVAAEKNGSCRFVDKHQSTNGPPFPHLFGICSNYCCSSSMLLLLLAGGVWAKEKVNKQVAAMVRLHDWVELDCQAFLRSTDWVEGVCSGMSLQGCWCSVVSSIALCNATPSCFLVKTEISFIIMYITGIEIEKD